jgi:hypothetical protein
VNRDQWWIDYLENEVTPTERQDMEMILAHSKSDQEILSGLKAVRASIEELDPIRAPKGQDFYQSLHTSIMDAVAELPQSQDRELPVHCQSPVKPISGL